MSTFKYLPFSYIIDYANQILLAYLTFRISSRDICGYLSPYTSVPCCSTVFPQVQLCQFPQLRSRISVAKCIVTMKCQGKLLKFCRPKHSCQIRERTCVSLLVMYLKQCLFLLQFTVNTSRKHALRARTQACVRAHARTRAHTHTAVAVQVRCVGGTQVCRS